MWGNDHVPENNAGHEDGAEGVQLLRKHDITAVYQRRTRIGQQGRENATGCVEAHMLRAWQTCTSTRVSRSTPRSEQPTRVQKREREKDAAAPQSNSCTSNRRHAARSLAHSTQSLTSPVGPTRSASRNARSPLPQQISSTVAPRVALRVEDSGRDICVRGSPQKGA